MSIKNSLYDLSRILNKSASIINDIETLASGDTRRITRRVKSKAKNKLVYGAANKVSKKLNNNNYYRRKTK